MLKTKIQSNEILDRILLIDRSLSQIFLNSIFGKIKKLLVKFKSFLKNRY